MGKSFNKVQLVSTVVDETRVELFSIDGVDYTIPATPRPNVGLKYLKTLRDKGQDIASAGLLIDLLGESGYTALMNCESLTESQFTQILEIVQDVALGATEDGSKN